MLAKCSEQSRANHVPNVPNVPHVPNVPNTNIVPVQHSRCHQPTAMFPLTKALDVMDHAIACLQGAKSAVGSAAEAIWELESSIPHISPHPVTFLFP